MVCPGVAKNTMGYIVSADGTSTFTALCYMVGLGVTVGYMVGAGETITKCYCSYNRFYDLNTSFCSYSRLHGQLRQCWNYNMFHGQPMTYCNTIGHMVWTGVTVTTMYCITRSGQAFLFLPVHYVDYMV